MPPPGGRGSRAATRHIPDLILLNVSLLDMGGFDTCRTARERGNSVPVLFLTGLGGVDDRVRGTPQSGPAALRVTRGEFVGPQQSSGSRTPPRGVPVGGVI
ncbi:hypothetical protein OG235_27040 [Streptomyces sp. NBC_00024]|uniref:response regulator transcription factor n=1 Tax=Streptomyces sp. NBC_00024 TaxID=2903612 RepID=UPI00325136A4